MSTSFNRSGGFRKSTTSSMPNRFSAPSTQMPNTALPPSTPTVNVGGNVSTSMSNLSVASKPTEVKCVDWPEYVGRSTPMRGEQVVHTRDMQGTFNNAKLLKQIVDRNAESLLVRGPSHSSSRPQSQLGHQPTHQPLVSNRSAIGGESHALSSDIPTGATTPANGPMAYGRSYGFKKPHDPVATTPELSALEQMKNAGLKPGVNPNKVFYERSDSSISPTSVETPQPKQVDTMGLELARMRRLQEIMKAIQQNPILEDIVKNTMTTIKKFANLSDEDSKLLDTCFAHRY